MSIKIYKDPEARAIFMMDANGVQHLNSLQATVDDGLCSIKDLAKNWDLVTGVPYTEFVDHNDNLYGNDAIEVVNALNAIFSDSGTPTTNKPTVVSNLSVSLTAGESINYIFEANDATAYEWDFSNVPGITTKNGNDRILQGGSELSEGTYTIPINAINLNGVTHATIVLTVSTPPFANTKSVQFNNQDYLGANAALLDSILGRVGNGSGSGDAWTIAFWFKGSTSTNNGQTIFYFGDNDTTNGGHLYVRYQGGNQRLRFRYGSNNNHLLFHSANNSLTDNTWHHVIITYDGGTTGSSSADTNDYYSRFSVYIDGVDAISGGSWSHSNYGWSSGIDADNLRVGRYASGNYMQSGCKIDELAVWNSDQSANVSDIYNGGTPFDLLTLTDKPPHWWPVDGSTYSYLQDSGTEANCVFQMYNMTAADIVSDVP